MKLNFDMSKFNKSMNLEEIKRGNNKNNKNFLFIFYMLNFIMI